jgi:hypothetical protein
MRTKRGGFLTTIAILLALVAIEDVLKPFGRQGPTTAVSLLPRIQPGIAVLGVRHTGSEAAILGPLVAAILVLYAIGIWRMNRYAVTVAWIYTVYVISIHAVHDPKSAGANARRYDLPNCLFDRRDRADGRHRDRAHASSRGPHLTTNQRRCRRNFVGQ